MTTYTLPFEQGEDLIEINNFLSHDQAVGFWKGASYMASVANVSDDFKIKGNEYYITKHE